MLRRYLIAFILAIFLIYPHMLLAQDSRKNTLVFLSRSDPFSIDYPDGWEVTEGSGGAVFKAIRTDNYVLAITDIMLIFACDIFLEPPASSQQELVDQFAQCLLPNWSRGVSEADPIEIAAQRDGFLYRNENLGSGELELILVIAYPDQKLQAERYVVFMASGSIQQAEELEQLLMSMATSLKVGNEVMLEKATVTQTYSIPLNISPDMIYPVALANSQILGLGVCGTIVEMSLDGTISNTIEPDDCYHARTLYPAPDGSTWMLVAGSEDAYGPVNSILNVSLDGTIQGQIPFSEPDNTLTYSSPQVAADASGNVYVMYTTTHESEEPTAINLSESETWIQVWSSNGQLQREFQAHESSYAISPGQNAIQVGPDGLLYFLDSDRDGIRIFDTDGTLIKDKVASNKVTIGNVSCFRFAEDGTMFVGVYPASILPLDDAAILHLDADGRLLGIFPFDVLGISPDKDSSQDRMSAIPIDISLNSDGELIVLARTATGTQILVLTITPPSTG